MSRPIRVSKRKRDAEALHEPEVHLDGFAREAEGRHTHEHRAAGHGQLVEDGDLVAGHGELTGHGEAGGAGADHGDGRIAWRDQGHLVGDARLGMPLHEEALHGPDGQRAVDITAPTGTLTRRGADVRAHGRHGIGLARKDVTLLEASLCREVQVAAAVGAHGARFLALDVALQPGCVHGLDEELLAGVDDHAVIDSPQRGLEQ